ncbi:TPA: RHS repeat-associated core domain-containing protein, partial [Escherichia coli]|nr:RHS repeat protein [Escherichia coli]
TAQTDAAGRRTEYGLNVVSGDITDITTPDGRETKFYYNDGNQLTAVVSPDGLESRRAYDEPGRLVSETSRSGDVIRYAYDNPHSELPATTTDATGSTRQMTWSRYGQLLAFTDCSGYQTRYEYDRFGQMTAVHREEGNRIAEDAHYVYHYDEYGRLTEKTDLIPAGVIRTDDERTHHYHYDSQHRLVFHTRIQHGEPLVESRYLYDPLGRRMAKRVWRRERDLTGWMSLSRKPEMTWYGWDGDRLTTVQTDTTRIQTVYQPGSFAPLIRIETDNGEREKAQRRSLAEKLQQEGSEDGHGVVFPAELVRLLDRLEEEIRADRVSSESRAWLAQCGLTVEQLARQVEPEYTPARKVHFYHCDHRGLPLALISEDGNTAWRGEYDEWGNQLNEENPYYLHQPYRLPGQQHDEESGLYYNRNRYYDPLQGRYITQDPIGLAGGWNLYNYPLNPIIRMDPLGLYNLYQLLYDVWHDDSYGTSSIDITGSGDLISLGGHAGLGVAFAKKKGEMLSDICIYATACGHAGIGGGINAAITYSETKSLPTSGVSNSVGVTVGGGVGGHFAYTYVVDVDNPESSTESVGIGAGVDASVMTLACRTWQECWVN